MQSGLAESGLTHDVDPALPLTYATRNFNSLIGNLKLTETSFRLAAHLASVSLSGLVSMGPSDAGRLGGGFIAGVDFPSITRCRYSANFP